jgi:hypothetical protein
MSCCARMTPSLLAISRSSTSEKYTVRAVSAQYA